MSGKDGPRVKKQAPGGGTAKGGGRRADAPFWQTKTLGEMSRAEWESLCDGCGQCCALKLEDEDTGAIAYTNVACRLFDSATCRCGNYALRTSLVPGCIVLTPQNLPENAYWLPFTCAYRRLHEGKGLAAWHPLVSGDPGSVHAAGVSVLGSTVPEYEVAEEDLEDHILDRDIA